MELTAQTYKETRARINAFEAWRNGRTSYRTEDIPAHVPRLSNEEISACEVYEFTNKPPERYFAYVKTGELGAVYGASGTLATWTGDKLGNVRFGSPYRDNFGGERVPVRVYAINGQTYAGTYYKSAGDYARVKRCKTPADRLRP